jgi:phosphatidate cytidylyltransferase
MASTLFVYAYVGGLGGFAGLVLGFNDGIGILLGLVLCVVANDIAAYFGGRRFGRRPLTAISPNKTVEGFVAGAAGSLLVGVVLVGSITPWDRPSALFLGLIIALLAPLGDICESMIKRDLGVKDLGGILPGHGGVLDRFDAILFCLPAVYYLVRLLDIA